MPSKKRVKRMTEAAEQERIESLFRQGAKRFLRDKVSVTILCLLALICLAAIAAPLLGLDYETLEPRRMIDGVTYKPPFSPSLQNIFGTDQLGRDLLVRILYGLGVSLVVGVIARGGSMLLGTIIGLSAGYYGGKLDTVLMRITDITLAFPAMLIAMAITFVLDPSMATVCIAITLVGWPDIARIIRAQTLVLKNKEYVKAARAMGLSNIGIILKHILPNS
ncbi:MAG: ABC transporter permease, partial [Bacillota bacterium]